jgi:hypothetical protein
MIYSCFDQNSGLYRYFQDNTQIPVNGDLPVPNYLKGRATKLGVPALEAGRPLPPHAKAIGTGLQARGMIVSCGRPGAAFGGTLSPEAKSSLVIAGALGTAALLWYTDQQLSAITVGGITLAALVL